MGIWKLLDAGREKLRLAQASHDLGWRGLLLASFFLFCAGVFFAVDRTLFYPWMVFLPLAAALLYDPSWIWAAGLGMSAVGMAAAVGEGLFATTRTGCAAAFLFSLSSLWIARGITRSIGRIDDARAMRSEE